MCPVADPAFCLSPLGALHLAGAAWTEWHFLEVRAIITGHLSPQPGVLNQGSLKPGASATELAFSEGLLVGSFLWLFLNRTWAPSPRPAPTRAIL